MTVDGTKAAGKIPKVQTDGTTVEWDDDEEGTGGSGDTVEAGTGITLTGTSPKNIAVTNPFTDADETKLDSVETDAKDDQTAEEIKDELETLTSDDRLDATAIKNLAVELTSQRVQLYEDSSATTKTSAAFGSYTLSRAPVSGRYLEIVLFYGTIQVFSSASDEPEDRFTKRLVNYVPVDLWLTLESHGDGTDIDSAIPLKVGGRNEMTVTTTEGFSHTTIYLARTDDTNARLACSHFDAYGPSVLQINEIAYLTPVESGNGDIVEEGSGITITKSGSSATIAVTNPFTDADETKLDSVETDAKDDQTAEEIKDELETLTGDDRLDATAIKDLASAGVVVDSIDDTHINPDLTDEEGQNFREKIGASGASFYESVYRSMVADADRDTAGESSLAVTTSPEYNLKIQQNSDLHHIDDIQVGVGVRLSQEDARWEGRVISHSVSSDVHTILINFHTTVNTPSSGGTVLCEFGAITPNRTTVVFGENQTVRIKKTGITESEHTTIGSADLKQFSTTNGEHIKGGIAMTIGNLSTSSNADSPASVGGDATMITINETGSFRIKLKFLGNQEADTDATIHILRVLTGTDDSVVVENPGFSNGNLGLGALLISAFEAEESHIPITSGDEFYMRLRNHDNEEDLLTGYIEFERLI